MYFSIVSESKKTAQRGSTVALARCVPKYGSAAKDADSEQFSAAFAARQTVCSCVLACKLLRREKDIPVKQRFVLRTKNTKGRFRCVDKT